MLEFLSLQSGLKFLRVWTRREARLHDWLPIVCHIVLSRLIETLTSFLMCKKKKKKDRKKKGLKYFRPWIFTMQHWIMQQSVNYSSLWLCCGHALKSMQNGYGPSVLCQHISLRIAYQRDLSLRVDFVLFFFSFFFLIMCFKSCTCYSSREAIPVDKCCVSRGKHK